MTKDEPIDAEHHILREQPGSDMRYRCTCGWATEWGRLMNATAGAAAVRHAGGMPEPRRKTPDAGSAPGTHEGRY